LCHSTELPTLIVTLAGTNLQLEAAEQTPLSVTFTTT
jgi:hypothetical protein